MIRTRHSLTLLAFAAFSFALPTQAQDSIEAIFRRGVELLDESKAEQALDQFQKVLALAPSHEAAYELWQRTEDQVWFRMLAEQGEMELIAKRLISLASMGRRQHSNDPDAVRALLKGLDSDNVLERRRTIAKLASDHGEFAVEQMVHVLADQAGEDRRVRYIQALTQMGTDVVLPLVAALDSDDAFQRRNVAWTLGYIADRRARGTLAKLAQIDPDAGVREAARGALERNGGAGGAELLLLAEANGYYEQTDAMLRPHEYSEVVWSFEARKLVATETPRFLYNLELAKTSFYRALEVNPSSLEALAGISRCTLAERERIDQLDALGQDTADWGMRIANDEVAVRIAGSQALDRALGWSLERGDQLAASGLCRALAQASFRSTPNLRLALSANRSGAVRGEAAVALARISLRSNRLVGAATVAALAESAAREVVQIAAIIDGDDERRERMAAELEGRGMHVNRWSTGGRGLAMIRSIPGVDLLLVADRLPDLTANQVIQELKADPRTAGTPIVLLTDDGAAASELYGDVTESAVTSIEGLGQSVEAAMGAGMNRDREQARTLALASAEALAALAASGQGEVAAVAGALGAIVGRSNRALAVAAMGALGYVGDASSIDALVSVLTDGDRSEEERLAAAQGLGGIFGRLGGAGPEVVEALNQVAISEGQPLNVRAAAAIALGRLNLSQEARAGLMLAVRNPASN